MNPDRLFFTCTVIGASNLLLFCAASLALWRVLDASARDAYNSPRRRLLELDDGLARRGHTRLGNLCAGYHPWTTQKALLAMVAFAAAVRMAWAVVTSRSWDARLGVVRALLQESPRVVFFGLDFFEAAAIFTVYTIVARFWAELACTAREGTMATRPLGGGDEYRPRGTPPLLWKMTKPVQRGSCLIAYAAATLGTFLQAAIWRGHETYMGLSDGLTEGTAFLLAALVMSTFAHYAIVELRLVPIELPTRRRRVYNIAAVTATCSCCMLIRSGILVWVANKAIPVVTNVEVACVLTYFLLLETMPLTIVLMYNRSTPSPATHPNRASAISGRGRSVPEEEPLMGGSGRLFAGQSNPFGNQTEIPPAAAHR